MNGTLLDPNVAVDGPILHGDAIAGAYPDEDDMDIVDDVSAPPAEAEYQPAWTVDTGYGEFVAPTGEEKPLV
jgi:hypothetical protein